MLEIFLILLAIALIATIWQHLRYQRIRLDLAQDRQHPLHSSEVFHVVVFFKLKSGDRVVETARQFNIQMRAFSATKLIYAGQAAFTANAQVLGNRDWDGVLLFEYRSRSDYEQSRIDPRTRIARQLFADSYLHGMRRNRNVSLFTPQLLLRQRLQDLVTGHWNIVPLQAPPEFETAPEFQIWRNRVSRLQALNEVNRQGLVIFSLFKHGTAGYQDITALYGSELLSRMAALNYGPLHNGRTVALEEFARFDRIHITYYPSARYFAGLVASQYFHRVADNNLLGVCIMVPTVPITARL